MKNIIVVTGGAGFIGSNLIKYLLKKTIFKIISVDNYSTGSKKNHINHKNVRYIKDEIVTYSDINDLSKKIKKYSADDVLRMKIAKKGSEKYFKFFNSTIVAEFIINKSLNINKKYFWEK